MSKEVKNLEDTVSGAIFGKLTWEEVTKEDTQDDRKCAIGGVSFLLIAGNAALPQAKALGVYDNIVATVEELPNDGKSRPVEVATKVVDSLDEEQIKRVADAFREALHDE